MRRILIVAVLVCSAGLLFTGCGEGASVNDAAAKYKDAATDAAGDLAEKGQAVGAEWLSDAEGMIAKLPEEMQAKATELHGKIVAQQGKLGEIKSKLSELSPQDLVSGSGKDLKAEAEKIGSRLTELQGELKTMLSKATEG